jgi:hypothetical protein
MSNESNSGSRQPTPGTRQPEPGTATQPGQKQGQRQGQGEPTVEVDHPEGDVNIDNGR